MLCRRWPKFERRISDLQGGYDDSATYRQLADWLQHTTQPGARTLYYLAIPPPLYPVVVEQLQNAELQNAGLNRADPPDGWPRVVIEKPFGHDLASARQLNAQVHAAFDEAQVYRIKHYLAKETVQNLLVFRFAYTIFEPLPRQHYVDHVRRAMAESVGVGHRAGYYGGVPFYVRSGKALAAKTTEITLVFRQAPHLLFASTRRRATRYRSTSSPTRACTCASTPRSQASVFVPNRWTWLSATASCSVPGSFDAYERLLLDAMQVDASLFARSDEIKLAWQLTDPLTSASVRPLLYPSDSEGPAAAMELLAREGRAWRPLVAD